MNNIRNFVIIAHVDHGKSTLADRLLEETGTIERRKMKEQYLDQLDLERERGITIKMAPVRMSYKSHILNLIDTPGHSDFSYEVSRALHAVEGAVLLVDATQGIQAQTLANFRLAKAQGLTVLGAVNKVDLFKLPDGTTNRNDERIVRAISELSELTGISEENIFLVSGKTGEGAGELLDGIVRLVPPPEESGVKTPGRALVFDSFFDDHKGVVASVRVFSGSLNAKNDIYLSATRTSSKIKEIGYFFPQMGKIDLEGCIGDGEIGYVATGIRDTEKIQIGDTLIQVPVGVNPSVVEALPGYREPHPVVFVSFYPEDNDDYDPLKRGLQKLKLSDSALSIEPDQNEVLGRGFKVGFLGRLHFEIISERLKREFNVHTVNTFPSVMYRVRIGKEWRDVVKPEELPQVYDELWEPMINIDIILPQSYLASVLALQKSFRFSDINTETIGDRVKLSSSMPLAELVSDFDDQLKSATRGLASFSYEVKDYAKADVVRVDIVITHEPIPGLSRFLPRDVVEHEARRMVERLKDLLPRQQFNQPIQASADGRIVAREDIPAMKKQLGNFGKNGGDRTRKMKLWQKQKKGKKRLDERSTVQISPETFKELLKR